MVIDELMALRRTVADLQQQVRVDPLTELFNFRHFSQSLAQELQRTQRTAQPTAMLMVDLDHFKQVNDRWGHEAGNQALITTGQVIKNNIRQLDIACRYGGEEFAIILPATSMLIAIQVAERIRREIAASPLLLGDKALPLTASLGVDVFSSTDTDSPEHFVQRVDQYMYQAKQLGRNRVCHATLPVEQRDSAVSKAERDALSDFFGDDAAP